MARRTVPTVGAKQLHTVQVSPRVRRIEARRTRKAAQREAAPVLASDRATIGEANREYGVQKRSIQGATKTYDSALLQALGGLKGSGLSGKYLGQTKSELLSRLTDAAQTVPYLLAEAGEERTKARREGKQELRQDKASMQQNALQAFDQRLKELRDKGSTVIKDKEKEEKNGGLSKSEVKALESAAIAVKNFIDDWKAEPELRTVNPLKSSADWAQAAKFIAKENESATPADVAKILRRVRHRWQEDPNRQLKGINLPGSFAG